METYNLDLIQVLWVEDDPKVTQSYRVEAETLGLQLEPYSCWDDAKKALEKDYDRWSAIILDAKCKYHRDSADNAVVFLREALKDIAALSGKKGRVIPWYVLTGGDIDEVSDSINDDRLEWDEDWTKSSNKNYYSKSVDRETLYRRIRHHANKSPRLQIQSMYRNVLEAIEECGIDDKGYNALEELLIPIHFPKGIKDADYNVKFEKAREVLEYIFRSMSVHGILPKWGKEVNLRWSSCILSGIDAINKKENIVVIKSNEQVLSPVLKRALKEMVDIIPAFCHSDNEEEGEIKKEEYFSNVDNSTYLLKSFAFQLCDIVLWYRNYLKTHLDVKENKSKWEYCRESDSNVPI